MLVKKNVIFMLHYKFGLVHILNDIDISFIIKIKSYQKVIKILANRIFEDIKASFNILNLRR